MSEDSSGAGQATAPATTEASSSVTTEPSVSAPASTENTFSIPEKYQEEKWATNIKSEDSLWDSYANAQGLIGKKTIGVPTADSSDEEWNDFYSKTRPESAENYNFEGVAEADAEAYSKVFFDNGVSERQAQNLIKALNESTEAKKAEMYSQEGLDKIVTDIFGDDVSAKEAVQKNLRDNLSDADKAVIDSMPNEFVGLLYRAVDANLKSFGASEGTGLNNPTDKMVLTEDQLNDKRSTLRQQIADLDKKPHNRDEKTKLINELSKTYQTGGNK